MTEFTGGAKRSERKPNYHQIPFCAIQRLAKRFAGGSRQYDDPAEAVKLNGAMNWQAGDEAYWTDAFNHAVEHLLLSKSDDSDDHLAAVMWYCATRMWKDESTQPAGDPSADGPA
jgi:hypothetical protein